MSDRMTQTEYANARGVSKQYVNKFIKKHSIALDKDKKFDPALIDQIRSETADPSRRMNEQDDQNPSSPPHEGGVNPDDSDKPSGPNYRDAKTASEIYASQIKKIEYRKLAGELVELNAAMRAGFDVGQLVKEKFMSSIPKIKGDVVAVKTETEAVNFLRKTYKTILEDINKDVRGRLRDLS